MSLFAFALMALPSPALPGKDTDYPHRDWGQVATLDMTVAEATACIARVMDREGSVLVLPVEGGNDLDYTAGTMFGSLNEPWVRFQIRGSGATTLRIFYRHPVNQKWLRRVNRNFAKTCLKVIANAPTKAS